ncbi:ESX secretion-associated protein EspG [Nocardia jiangxiensis]|uniref:ESX secretion-associated protein EspG n=1 Tax=Nocardia jiangxiensis TaxID=282685 RepID=A0ABW6RT19_9NOCA|nr:ESX secretion-associated protein EspG [Nocardia jiangxiensis]
MTRTWKLGEAEFFVLWKDHTDDIMPLPFSYTSRAKVSADFAIELAEARATLREKMDQSLEDVVRSIIEPDLYVTVTGWDEADPLRFSEEIRVMATRRGPQGYLLTQAPGDSFWHGGGYSIVECDPLLLADEAVAILPEMPAGKRGQIVLTDDEADLDYDFGSSAVEDTFTDTEYVHAKNFLETTAVHAGQIIVAQGPSMFGPRGHTEHTLKWRDIEDDGRYAITDEHPPVAIPADAGTLKSLINNRIADVVRVIKEERSYNREQ